MAKADTAKKKKAKPKRTDKEQSERFIETARKLRVDESGKEFERVASNLLKPRKSVPRQS
jgi:hypothetical protein